MSEEADLSKFGVPAGRAGIVQALPAYRFRLRVNGLPTITANTERVAFNFATKQITVTVRQTVEPEAFTDAMDLASGTYNLRVEALGFDDNVLFTIVPTSLNCDSHEFGFDYAEGNKYATHKYVFSCAALGTEEMIQGTPAEHDGDERFPTIQDAMKKLEAKKANS